jgi:hypothetical protein
VDAFSEMTYPDELLRFLQAGLIPRIFAYLFACMENVQSKQASSLAHLLHALMGHCRASVDPSC